jgi:chemotaxis protein histidine kinase CheA
MYGLERVAEKCHAIESRIDSLRSRRADVTVEAIAEVKSGMQELEDLFARSLQQINSILPEEERTARERLFQIPVSKIEQFRRYLGKELPNDAAGRILQAFEVLHRQPIGKVFRQYALAAKELGRRLEKEVDVQMQGGEVEVPFDRLEPLFASMVHLIRNAVDHGLESPAQRRRLGKPEAGRLVLGAERDGQGLTLTVSDDGTGINLNLVRSTALKIGLVDSGTVAGVQPADLLRYIFLPGFSTKEKATLTSGRGVGLDAVKASLDPLGGRIQVMSRSNHGTTIRMLIPAM